MRQLEGHRRRYHCIGKSRGMAMAYRLVAMVLVPTILGFLLAIGKAFAQLQSKDKTGRLVNLRCKAKCADGLSRETLNASRRDTVNVEVTADWVESAGTLLRASTSKTVWGTVRRRLNSYLLGTVLFAGARYLVGHRREVGLATPRRRSNHRATVASRKRIALPNLDKGLFLGINVRIRRDFGKVGRSSL
jgi:hypothetical protein